MVWCMPILDYHSRSRTGAGFDLLSSGFFLVQGVDIAIGTSICWWMAHGNLGWGVFLEVPVAIIAIALEFCFLSLWGIFTLSGDGVTVKEWGIGLSLSLAGPLIAAAGTWWGFVHAHAC